MPFLGELPRLQKTSPRRVDVRGAWRARITRRYPWMVGDFCERTGAKPLLGTWPQHFGAEKLFGTVTSRQLNVVGKS